jgi:chemotaxis protein methyltransferase CheR
MAFTYFFRDVQTLELACDHALPVLKTRRYINIWDAGCAMGPEPYTLAIILRENGTYVFPQCTHNGHRHRRKQSIWQDHPGRAYPREQVERIPQDLFNQYFEKAEKEGHFRIVEEIRRALRFVRMICLPCNPRAMITALLCVKMCYCTLMKNNVSKLSECFMIP